MKLGRMAAAAAAILAIGVYAAGPALAASRTQELPSGDYGYVDDDNTNLVICDREADDRTAYSEASSVEGTDYRVNDQDGSGGSCWWIDIPTGVDEHTTCEDINNWPDDCSDQGWSLH